MIDIYMEILFFIVIICLVGLLFYKEAKNERMLVAILTAKLSQGAGEFRSAISKPNEDNDTGETSNEIPLEDLSAEEMLGVLQKNK